MEYKIKNFDLCQMLWNSNAKSMYDKVDFILVKIKSKSSFDENQIKIIKKKLLNTFIPDYNRKWQSVKRVKSVFLKKYEKFLETEFTVNVFENLQNTNCSSIQSQRGRPRLSFQDGSEKTKKRRIQELALTCTKEELSKALEITVSHSDSESEIEVSSEDNKKKFDKILAMYIDLDLTKRKYEKLRTYNKEISGNDSYPPYRLITEAKKTCYPYDGEHIESSDVGASVHFISLLGHTVKRILLQVEKDDLAKISGKKLVLMGKWGMDGAHANQMTRQKWSMQTIDVRNDDLSNDDNAAKNESDGKTDEDDSSEEDSTNINNSVSKSKEKTSYDNINDSDKAFFLISFVPLQLKADDNIIWTNETPSSVHFCRTIKFQFLKETDSLVRKEFEFYTNLLNKVHTYSIDVNEMIFNISFNLKCTMVDGKICNVLTGQKASSCCNICGVGPKFVNNLTYVASLPCNEAHYKFGLSTLHMWIRILEYLLHVAYNQDFKKFYARTKDEKEMKKLRKRQIQRDLQSKLSLTVDVVKQGYGTTNTGNVARSFMEKAESVAEITGLDKTLVTRFHNILQVITCGKMVNCVKFKSYCLDTAQLCIDLYSWYKLPPSVHKLLIHGSEIIKSFELPIGFYSEESQEGSNKIFRKARANNSRMCDRRLTNIDIMQYLLLHSDPLVSSYRIKQIKKAKPLSKVAESMIVSNE